MGGSFPFGGVRASASHTEPPQRSLLTFSTVGSLPIYGRISTMETDLDREIQNHIAYEAEESGGGRALGNIALVKEDVREAWGGAGMEQFARDIQFGWRQVRRTPSFSAIAIGTLALGIGGIAAVF